VIRHVTFWHQLGQQKIMTFKQLSVYLMLTFICNIWLVLTAHSHFPDVRPLEDILPSFLLPIFSIRWIETIILQCLLKLILQNLKVKVPIHPTINLDSIANTLPSHATPHHQGTTSKLQSSLYQPIIEHLTCLFPSPLVSI